MLDVFCSGFSRLARKTPEVLCVDHTWVVRLCRLIAAGMAEPVPAGGQLIGEGDYVVLKREDVFKAVQVQRRK